MRNFNHLKKIINNLLKLLVLLWIWGCFLFTLPGVVYLRSKHPCFLQPGLFKEVKGLGWYLEEHDVAQVSLNLCDFNITSLHTVYEECCKIAKVRNASLLHMLIGMYLRN